MAVDLVGIQTVDHLNRIFQLNNHDFNVSSNLKQAVSALTRSGHARFRRGPPSSDPHAPSVSSQSKEEGVAVVAVADATTSFQSMTSSLGFVAPAPSFSSRKPPLPSSHRKRHGNETTPSASLQGSRTTCHCCKRRKIGSKREVKRIPIIGSKVESIPADDYSWKKYGEKKVYGSPFPRVYYKCNSFKGCPARKRVELSITDSKMLVVTYDGEHRHYHRHRHTPTPLPASLNSLE